MCGLGRCACCYEERCVVGKRCESKIRIGDGFMIVWAVGLSFFSRVVY